MADNSIKTVGEKIADIAMGELPLETVLIPDLEKLREQLDIVIKNSTKDGKVTREAYEQACKKSEPEFSQLLLELASSVVKGQESVEPQTALDNAKRFITKRMDSDSNKDNSLSGDEVWLSRQATQQLLEICVNKLREKYPEATFIHETFVFNGVKENGNHETCLDQVVRAVGELKSILPNDEVKPPVTSGSKNEAGKLTK